MHRRMNTTGSLAQLQPGCLHSLHRRCASTACQTACQGRRAVPLSQQFSNNRAFRQSCMQQRSGGTGCRGSKAIAPQALFNNMFKSDEGGKTRKKYQQRVDQINALERKYEQMDDEQLKQQTETLRSRVARGEALESVLPEAFAVSKLCLWCIPDAILSTQRSAGRGHSLVEWKLHGALHRSMAITWHARKVD